MLRWNKNQFYFKVAWMWTQANAIHTHSVYSLAECYEQTSAPISFVMFGNFHFLRCISLPLSFHFIPFRSISLNETKSIQFNGKYTPIYKLCVCTCNNKIPTIFCYWIKRRTHSTKWKKCIDCLLKVKCSNFGQCEMVKNENALRIE